MTSVVGPLAFVMRVLGGVVFGGGVVVMARGHSQDGAVLIALGLVLVGLGVWWLVWRKYLAAGPGGDEIFDQGRG